MKILITNQSLLARGGTQSFVRSLGIALQNLGHSVLAYTSDTVHRMRPRENSWVQIAGNLERLPFQPDVIHAQHHMDAMAALTALPDVPAVYHCHSAVWHGCAVKHPRIYRYLTMSRTLKERLVAESNIPECDIEVFFNSIDLARFPEVRGPPVKPARALFYNSRHEKSSSTIVAIREAAGLCGLELDLVGKPFGNETDDPGRLLPRYDIVFASGLSAIEAAACGCAVIALGRTSCGEMVLPDNYERLRQVNFSIAANSPAPVAGKIAAEIRQFAAEGSAEITSRVRHDADFNSSVRTLIGVYENIIEQHKTKKHARQAEIPAISGYLRKLAPLIQTADHVLDRKWPYESGTGTLNELSARTSLIEERMETTNEPGQFDH